MCNYIMTERNERFRLEEGRDVYVYELLIDVKSFWKIGEIKA